MVNITNHINRKKKFSYVTNLNNSFNNLSTALHKVKETQNNKSLFVAMKRLHLEQDAMAYLDNFEQIITEVVTQYKQYISESALEKISTAIMNERRIIKRLCANERDRIRNLSKNSTQTQTLNNILNENLQQFLSELV